MIHRFECDNIKSVIPRFARVVSGSAALVDAYFSSPPKKKKKKKKQKKVALSSLVKVMPVGSQS